MTRETAAGCLAALVFALFARVSASSAQTVPSLGTVSNPSQLMSCPSALKFATGVNMTCFSAKLTGCSGDADLPFTYGVATPPSGPVKGTIVMLSGSGGTKAQVSTDENTLAQLYVGAGYQIVQVAWNSAWEYTAANTGTSIRNAACRPASFLNWVRNGTPSIWGGNGGMCAQGLSAGSGAVAYSLAWYNAGAATATATQGYLDKVALIAGPVFGDIEQGCEVPNNNYTLMCVAPGQTGCQGWNPAQDPPGDLLEYVNGNEDSVNMWSGNTGPACGGQVTTTYNTNWLQMSVVDFTSTQQPTFNYPNTAMSAWLCEYTSPGVPENNSSPQGQLFYQQFTSQSQAGNSLTVNAVTNCPSTEGALAGTPPTYTGQTIGYEAVLNDMTVGTGACLKRH